MVPQSRNLDRDLTVREVLTYHGRYFGLPAAEREARADRLLARCRSPTRRTPSPSPSRAGMQQRVMIARALMHDPKVLLLDEPTTGLDPQARRLLWDTLRELHARGLTLILTTHYMEEADRLCQRLAIVDHGRILTIDTPGRAQEARCPAGRSSTCGCEPSAPLAPAARGAARACCASSRSSARRATTASSACASSWTRADGLLDRVLHAVRDARRPSCAT